jgi:cytochrome P450
MIDEPGAVWDWLARMSVEFDLAHLPDAFYDDPYPIYRALREHEPVKHLPDGGIFLSRHADLARVYRDTAAFSSDKKEFGAKYGTGSRLFRHHTTSMVFNDAPYHARVRRTILGALIPRALAPLAPKLTMLVARLLDDAADRGTFDAVAEFAAAIPVEVIGDLLLVPDADRVPLRGWSLAILGALEPALSDAAFERGEKALGEFHAYLRALIAERRARPGDAERDVLTRLLQSAEPLSEDELVENCVFLLNAGHETTTNLIGNALELFARFPDERRRIADDPASSQRDRGSPALRKLQSARQPAHNSRHRDRRHSDSGRDLRHARHRRRQSRSGRLPGSRPLRRGAAAEPASRLRRRTAPMRRHEPGAHGSDDRARGFPQALCGLHARRCAGAGEAREVPRVCGACRCAWSEASCHPVETTNKRVMAVST